MAQWVNRLWNNIFVNLPPLSLSLVFRGVMTGMMRDKFIAAQKATTHFQGCINIICMPQAHSQYSNRTVQIMLLRYSSANLNATT